MINIKLIRVTNMFISMLWTYSYNMGARRRLWMPFWPPFSTVCERFVKNTSSSRIKLIKLLFYRFILNQAKVFFSNPFRRGCPCSIGCIQRYHAIGGANGTTSWWCLCGRGVGDWRNSRYSYSRKPTGHEFFVTARTLMVVFLLIDWKIW